jgi:hypothetical protein
MLQLAGARADGTVTWMCGPSTLEQHVCPTITRGAEGGPRAAGDRRRIPGVRHRRPRRRARRRGKTFAIYGTLPSYQAMLAAKVPRARPDVAIVGDEAAVVRAARAAARIGVTDFVASVFGSTDDRARTYAYLPASSR